ncbi:1-acyl-sn-glycerol-3-phosphate acyltransferase [bacterium]|nr:1-acyl-sn-glycerol-3-phosphate acyltransferase [bacterium]MCI0604973.1 1-acyl-sn-glycerol-3-phosphate acyltransferase [bacterium]
MFYQRSMMAALLVSALKWLIRGLLRVFFGFKVRDIENIPIRGSYLVCPNHLSDIDPLLLYSILPDNTLYIAYEKNFRVPPLSWIIRYARVLLTSRGGKIPGCLVNALHGIQRGMNVCLFPEGGRTITGKLMEPRDGAGILSTQTDAPIIPVLIEGSQNLLSRLRPGFRLCSIRATIGKPLHPQGKECREVLDDWKRAIHGLREVYS